MSLSPSPAALTAGVAAAAGEAVAAAGLPGAGLDDLGMAVGPALEVGGAGGGLAAVATVAGRDAGGAAGVRCDDRRRGARGHRGRGRRRRRRAACCGRRRGRGGGTRRRAASQTVDVSPARHQGNRGERRRIGAGRRWQLQRRGGPEPPRQHQHRGERGGGHLPAIEPAQAIEERLQAGPGGDAGGAQLQFRAPVLEVVQPGGRLRRQRQIVEGRRGRRGEPWRRHRRRGCERRRRRGEQRRTSGSG